METLNPTATPADAAGSALDLTLGPITPAEFFETYWERELLVVSRGEPSRFEGLLSLEDAERIVCRSAIRTPAIRLAKDGATIPAATYTRDHGWSGGAFTGVARVDRVAEEYAAGATIILNALQLNWHPAALYCRDLVASLGCGVQANAYWTPGTARGFDVHHDTHDVFVLQMAGRKRWRFYEPIVELPLKHQTWKHGVYDAGQPVREVVLEPGDTLYVPRGLPHDATAEEGDSLHITVGIHVPTRLDALQLALQDCEDDVEFRRSVGADGAVPADLLEKVAARLVPEQLALRLRRKLLDGLAPVLDAQLTQVRDLDQLGLEDPLLRRPTVLSDLEHTGEASVLRFEGKELRLPRQADAALTAAHEAEGAFTAAELPGLDDPGRLVLARRLVREGFLQRV